MSSLGREWHGRGVRVLERLTGLRAAASETFADGGDGGDCGVQITLFPGLCGGGSSGSGVVRGLEDGRGWAAGAGAWMVDGLTGSEGLRRLLEVAAEADAEAAMLRADGAFGFILHPPPGRHRGGSGGVVAATDVLGSLHLYGARCAPGCYQVSTSSLGLAATAAAGDGGGGGSPQWDERSLQHFFSYGNVFGGRSLFRGIEKLPAASLVEIGPDGIRSAPREYWKIAEFCYDRTPPRGDAEELAATLERILRQIGGGGGGGSSKPILDLTGGFDSRAVFGAMLQAGQRFQTVTVGDATDPDVVTAQRIAREFGISHERRDRFDSSSTGLWSLCRKALPLLDGEADVILYTGALRTHLASAALGFGASVNGSVGEICKGQWWEALLPFVGRKGRWEEDTRKIAATRFAVHDVPPGLLAVGAAASDLAGEFTELVREATSGVRDLPNTAMVDLAYLRLRMQHWQGRFTSATQRVWQCWSPFGFREVLELALASPPERRVRHRLMRRLIEAQSPRLAAMPLAAGYPAMPLRWNTAHRFWPLAREVGEKVWRRLAGGGSGGGGVSAMGRLWEVEEVREMLLDPAGMRSLELYERGELGRMLERSRGGRDEEAVGRILTLEMAARAVADCRVVGR